MVKKRTLIDWLCYKKVVFTHAEARRLVALKVIQINDVVATTIEEYIPIGATIKIGKYRNIFVP